MADYYPITEVTALAYCNRIRAKVEKYDEAADNTCSGDTHNRRRSIRKYPEVCMLKMHRQEWKARRLCLSLCSVGRPSRQANGSAKLVSGARLQTEVIANA
jgi:hypothetical protein